MAVNKVVAAANVCFTQQCKVCVFPLLPSRPQSPVTTNRQNPEAKSPVKESASANGQLFVEASGRTKTDMTTFLQKLRDAAQPKPSWWVKPTRPAIFGYCDVLLVILIVK